MKFIALSAIVATAQAALGDDCFYDETICEPDGLACAKWEDSQYGPMASCEDCSDGDQQITDSFGDSVTYECPAVEEETSNGGGGGAPAPPSEEEAKAGEEVKASTIAVSAAVLLAASAILA